MKPLSRILPPCLLYLLAGLVPAQAHERGENYVFLEFLEDSIEGRFEFKYDDMYEKLGIDLLVDGEPSERRLKETASQVHQYIRKNFSISSGETPYELEFTKEALFNIEGGWAQYEFLIDTKPPPLLTIRHNMFYESDRMHRGVLIIEKGEWPGKDYEMQITMVFGPSNPTQTLNVSNPPEAMTPLPMIWQGVLHIWIGIDHILFLLALALPIVLVRSGDHWEPAPKLSKALWPLIKIVTVFTIAHSITLLLASLEIVTLPSRLVESIIALSIVLVAANNLFGRSHHTSLYIILCLGLFHGLGFASVMRELPFRIAELDQFILIILGFNLGVELGQIAILLAIFPILFALRTQKAYSPLVLNGGSAALICIASYWLVIRAFGL